MDEQLFLSLTLETKERLADQLADFIDQVSSFNVEQARTSMYKKVTSITTIQIPIKK